MDILGNKEKRAKLKASIQKLKEKYPGRVPIFVMKSKHDKILPDINSNKFIVPEDITVSDFMQVVRKRIELGHETSMFLFINEKVLPCTSESIGKLYNSYKNNEDVLEIYYCGENTFGN